MDTTRKPQGAARFRRFVVALTDLAGHAAADEARMIAGAKPLLRNLIATDDWLPDGCAVPHPDHYQQYLLYCDPMERFSVVSFVWGPGQMTPVHDHTVWGLVGMMRGSETCQNYTIDPDGALIGEPIETLTLGMVAAVSPTIGDIHRVANTLKDQPSISIHVYGANIGAVRRHVFKPDGKAVDFVSGYAAPVIPNWWDRAAEVRASL